MEWAVCILGSRQPDRCFTGTNSYFAVRFKNFGLADQPQVDWDCSRSIKAGFIFVLGKKI